MKNTTFEDLAQQLVKDINSFVENGRASAEAAFAGSSDQLRAVIESTLKRMDLVTREEFDAQQAVLLRTREMLTVLELQVADLEKAMAAQAVAEATKPDSTDSED